MRPALAPDPKQPLRSVFVFFPNGVLMDRWTPTKTGRGVELPVTLAPLKELRDHVTIHTNLALDAGRAHGDGPGDHARATATYLTAMHPKKTGGKDLRAGVSVDQLIAGHVGHATVLPSLELGMEAGRASGSTPRSCATRRWRWPGCSRTHAAGRA